MSTDHDAGADYVRAQRHLSRRDPVLKQLIRRIGPCTLRHDPDGFGVLARAIVSQQISGKAARSISSRLASALGRAGLCARGVVRATDETLRTAGLSAGKMRALRDLATRCHQGELDLSELPPLPDEEIIARLLQVWGIGRWTAEMFLIFSLGRLDILPLADLGLRAGVQRHYGLAELPAKQQLLDRAEAWRPYRTVATWFIWRGLGDVPQSS